MARQPTPILTEEDYQTLHASGQLPKALKALKFRPLATKGKWGAPAGQAIVWATLIGAGR